MTQSPIPDPPPATPRLDRALIAYDHAMFAVFGLLTLLALLLAALPFDRTAGDACRPAPQRRPAVIPSSPFGPAPFGLRALALSGAPHDH